jgi:hypothetical protein
VRFNSTRRGLLRAEFKDRYGAECSVQESSIPGEDCLWLGVEVDFYGDELRAGRMHIDRDLARQLYPVLRHFARTGSLGTDDPDSSLQVGMWVVGVGEQNRGIEGRIVQIGDLVVVQDWQRPGEEGQHICVPEVADLIWERIPMPETFPSRYERLMTEDKTEDK